MARRNTRPRPAPGAEEPDRTAPPPPEPVDVVDGIADRSAKPARWKLLLLALIFLLWVAFLIYCAIAGAP